MGRGGDDVLDGEDEANLIYNDGVNWLYGEAGNDRLIGGYIDDHLYGGDGDDSLSGGPASQWVRDGEDLLDGGDGRDHLVGGGERDGMYGQGSDDSLDAAHNEAWDVVDCGDGTNDYALIDQDLDGRDFVGWCERIEKWR